MNNRKFKKGMTLIEVVVSLALLGIIIVPISGYVLGSIKNSLESEKTQRASFVGERFLEEMKSYEEIVLRTSEEDKRYFQLLDGEILEEVSGNNFYGEFEKDKFKLEMEVKEDETLDYDKINNLENINGETFTLNLRENLGVASLEIKENLTKVSNFSNDLVLVLEEDLKISINDSLTGERLLSDISQNNLRNIIIINIEKSFSSNKNIEIRNKTGETVNFYLVKDNESRGKVNVFTREGSVFINDEIDLYEENIEGKRFNYSIEVKDQEDNIIFKGSSSSNLYFK